MSIKYVDNSGTFSQTKENYNTMEKEILATIIGIKNGDYFSSPNL